MMTDNEAKIILDLMNRITRLEKRVQTLASILHDSLQRSIYSDSELSAITDDCETLEAMISSQETK